MVLRVNHLTGFGAGSVTARPASYVFNGTDEHLSGVIPVASANKRQYSISCWIKLNGVATPVPISMGVAGTASANRILVNAAFDEGATSHITFLSNVGGTTNGNYALVTIPAPPTAGVWYHLLIAVDNSQATLANRCKQYMNGTQLTTTFATIMTQNVDNRFMASGDTLYLGCVTNQTAASRVNGRMAFIQIIEGTQVLPTDVGVNDSGTWKHKKYTGSFGTSGLHFNGVNGFTDTIKQFALTGTNMDATNRDFVDLPPYVTF